MLLSSCEDFLLRGAIVWLWRVFEIGKLGQDRHDVQCIESGSESL